MITQIILDFIATVLAGLIDLFPDLPPEVQNGVAQINAGVAYVMDILRPLGTLIPFDAIGAVASMWLAAIIYWGVILVMKVILWATTLWG